MKKFISISFISILLILLNVQWQTAPAAHAKTVQDVLASAVQVSTGYGHTCAVVTGGQLYCWGYNSDGQLGDGAITDQLTPTLVSGVGWVQSVSADNTAKSSTEILR
jgi:alpha-tubulin suppressor-like RCC1 family protein